MRNYDKWKIMTIIKRWKYLSERQQAMSTTCWRRENQKPISANLTELLGKGENGQLDGDENGNESSKMKKGDIGMERHGSHVLMD
jgi:hypothetical protein